MFLTRSKLPGLCITDVYKRQLLPSPSFTASRSASEGFSARRSSFSSSTVKVQYRLRRFSYSAMAWVQYGSFSFPMHRMVMFNALSPFSTRIPMQFREKEPLPTGERPFHFRLMFRCCCKMYLSFFLWPQVLFSNPGYSLILSFSVKVTSNLISFLSRIIVSLT